MVETIETLRTQVAAKPDKYVCKLRPMVEEYYKQNSSLNAQFLLQNPNPMAFDFVNQYHTDSITKHEQINQVLSQSQSASAMEYLEKNPEYILVYILLENPTMTQTLLDFMVCHMSETFNQRYHHLSSNPSDIALDYLLEHPDKISWMKLSENSNPRAVALLRENISKINWFYLCSNESDEAMEILELHQENICFDILSINSCSKAFELLMRFPEHINYKKMSKNKNPKAVAYMIKHPEKIEWYNFSGNPSAMEYLESHLDKIVDYQLLSNPAIFEYDYQSICEEQTQNMNLKELLMQIAYHPDRIDRLVKQGLTREEIVNNL